MTEMPEAPGATTPATELPAVIFLPDHSQPPPAKKRGRHFGPRPVTDPRTAWLPPTRVTPELRSKVEAQAAAAGLSLNAFIRARLDGSPGPRSRRTPGADTVVLAKLLAGLGKSGSNLNQIAYQLNCGEPVEPSDLAEAIAEHRAAAAAIMRALGV
jgi:HicB family